MSAAVIHIIGDIVQSIGIMLAAFCIWIEPIDVGKTTVYSIVTSEDKLDASGQPLQTVITRELSNWVYADPCCTFLFAILVLLTTRKTAK